MATKQKLELLLNMAVARIEIANSEGDKILSAWLPDAKKALSRADKNEETRRKVTVRLAQDQCAGNERIHVEDEAEIKEIEAGVLYAQGWIRVNLTGSALDPIAKTA